MGTSYAIAYHQCNNLPSLLLVHLLDSSNFTGVRTFLPLRPFATRISSWRSIMIRWLFTTPLFLVIATFSNAQDLLPEVPSTPEQDSLIAIGIRWHDRKDYNEAIEFYQKALQKNPANVTALYELAYSQYEKGDLQEALQTAMEGVRYNSPTLPRLYMMIANIYDDRKESDKAVEIYQKAIAISPDFHLLHYNLALTLTRMRQGREAETSLQKALQLNPFHTSSHLLLAQLWMARNLRIPALMAYTHFLLLEGGTKRAGEAAAMVGIILEGKGQGSFVSRSDNTINLSAAGDTSEGDFRTAEGMISTFGLVYEVMGEGLADSAGILLTDLDRFQRKMKTAVEIIGKEQASKTLVAPASFTQQFYLPWYSQVVRLNYVEVFCYLVAANCMIPGAESWLTEHQEEVTAFTKWIKEYRTPK